MVRETATSEAALGPVAIALAVGAMEGTSDGSLRAQRAGQAALHGILTAAVELGPYAEVLVTAALRRAAAVPPDLVAQVIHDVRALCLR